MKIFLASILFTLTSFTSNAQVWIDEGAVWHYDFWNLFVVGYYEYTYTQDTLIDGHLCQMIEGEKRTFFDTPDFDLMSESELSPQFTYVSGDTVFYRNNDEFHVLLNFGAEVGDSWVISTLPFDVCHDTSRVEVLETGFLTIDGEDYRTITIAPTSTSAYGFSGVFVERFGNVSAGLAPFLHPFPYAYECDSLSEVAIVEWDFVGFSCFQDNSFSLYNPYDKHCGYYTEIEENESQQISLYPNPATDFIEIKGIANTTQETKYHIYDLSGHLVQSGILMNQRIDLADLTSGTYFVQVNETFSRFIIN